jgi:hypothetical protein
VPFVVDVDLQPFEQALPFTALGPPVESVENRLPAAEFLGQIAPRHARSAPPEHCLDESAVVVPWPAGASLAVENCRDLRPLSLIQLRSNHHGSLMEHTIEPMEIGCNVHRIFRWAQNPIQGQALGQLC